MKFVVANIWGGPEMLSFAAENGIPNIDISVDIRFRENTNYPYDRHPSALANQKYAKRLERYLRAGFLN